MPPLQTLDMLNVSLACDGKARSFQPPHAELHSIERNDLDGLFTNVIDEPGKVKHPVGNVGLELCFARKDDHRLDDVGRQKVEQFPHRADMPKILDDGVLKPELPIEQDLSPAGLIRVPEDPAFVVLGFDHEDAKPRNKDVVNLSGAIPHLKGDVIHQVVVGGTEVLSCGARKPHFAAILKSVNSVVPVAKCKSNGKGEEDVEDGTHAFGMVPNSTASSLTAPHTTREECSRAC